MLRVVIAMLDQGVFVNIKVALCHLACRKMWYNKGKASLRNSSSFSRKESMSLNPLLPDLPGCSVDHVSQTEESIVITASATTSSASCPDCQQVSSHVHSTYTRSPRSLPSSGRPFVCTCTCEGSAVPTRPVAEKPLQNSFLS